jgi:predicted LPLAT superfamily acyltransferase
MELNAAQPPPPPAKPPAGIRAIRFWDRALPFPLNRWVRSIGALVAMGCMAPQRRHSMDYLSIVHGKRCGWRCSWLHFSRFTDYLCDRVHSAWEPVLFEWADGEGKDFLSLIHRDGPLLLGTFHVGYSDLMGFFTEVFQKQIHMLRLKTGNGEDTESLRGSAGEFLKVIWVNHPEDTLFAIKDVLEKGGSVAMQCDRVQHASKLEAFEFFGERRLFPFSIYALSILFGTPVLFVIAGKPASKGKVPVHSSLPFFPDPGKSRKANHEAAKAHFQEVLRMLESLLREDPCLWFNFEPMNPIAKT